KLTPDGANAARTTKGQERHVSLTQLYGRGRYYALGLVQTEPASIRSVSRRKVLAMASSVSSSHTHSCSGVANGSDCPGSKPKERMKPRDDCGTLAVSILRVA